VVVASVINCAELYEPADGVAVGVATVCVPPEELPAPTNVKLMLSEPVPETVYRQVPLLWFNEAVNAFGAVRFTPPATTGHGEDVPGSV